MMVVFFLIVKRINGLKPLGDLFKKIDLESETNETSIVPDRDGHVVDAIGDVSLFIRRQRLLCVQSL